MGLSHFPHGVLATPNLGMGRLLDMFNSGNIFFVDGDGGSASKTGSTPGDPVALPSTAVGLAARNATVYVKPKTTSASAQAYYQDNITIPLTKPNISIVGAGNTGSNSGVQIKPLDVATHLVEVKGAGLTLENMRLTLNGGTADLKMSIVHAVNETGVATPAGLTIRGCRFEGDKSVPSITSSTDMCSSIALGTVNYCTIEDNVFYSCHGGIVGQLSTASFHNVVVQRNIFSGAPANRCVDIWMNVALAGVMILNNVFADGLPTHAGATIANYFLYLADAGTGIIAGNYFATATNSFGAAGSEARFPDTFFSAGNTYDAASAGTTTAGMFGSS